MMRFVGRDKSEDVHPALVLPNQPTAHTCHIGFGHAVEGGTPFLFQALVTCSDGIEEGFKLLGLEPILLRGRRSAEVPSTQVPAL